MILEKYCEFPVQIIIMQNAILDGRDPQLAICCLGTILKWINVDIGTLRCCYSQLISSLSLELSFKSNFQVVHTDMHTKKYSYFLYIYIYIIYFIYNKNIYFSMLNYKFIYILHI